MKNRPSHAGRILASLFCCALVSLSSCGLGPDEPSPLPTLVPPTLEGYTTLPGPTEAAIYQSKPYICAAVPRELIIDLIGNVKEESSPVECTWEYPQPSGSNSEAGYRRLIVDTYFSEPPDGVLRAHGVFIGFKENYSTSKRVPDLGDEAFRAYDALDYGHAVFRDSNLVVTVQYDAADGTGAPMGRERVMKRATRVAKAIEMTL